MLTIEAVAAHEAAHATGYWCFRVPVVSISIVPAPGCAGRVVPDASAETMRPFDRAVVSAMGPVAEQRFFGTDWREAWGQWSQSGGSDWEKFRQNCHEATRTSFMFTNDLITMQAAREQAQANVREYHRIIQTIQNALLIRRTLSGREMYGLF